jgi:hypothetical protein
MGEVSPTKGFWVKSGFVIVSLLEPGAVEDLLRD